MMEPLRIQVEMSSGTFDWRELLPWTPVLAAAGIAAWAAVKAAAAAADSAMRVRIVDIQRERHIAAGQFQTQGITAITSVTSAFDLYLAGLQSRRDLESERLEAVAKGTAVQNYERRLLAIEPEEASRSRVASALTLWRSFKSQAQQWGGQPFADAVLDFEASVDDLTQAAVKRDVERFQTSLDHAAYWQTGLLFDHLALIVQELHLSTVSPMTAKTAKMYATLWQKELEGVHADYTASIQRWQAAPPRPSAAGTDQGQPGTPPPSAGAPHGQH